MNQTLKNFVNFTREVNDTTNKYGEVACFISLKGWSKIHNNNHFCFRDRVPTVLVKEWPLVCTMFNGDSIMGPVPTLFAENIEVIIQHYTA